MWTAVSGLLAHGDKMNVVGNNIANVSTIGFKSQRMDFNDYLYIERGSTSGPTQIGEGVSIYAVLGDFSQGAFESTNSGTDIAIDGNGFFGVRQPNSKSLYYTRAGDFYFNKDRELVNPEGYNVQGLRVDNKKEIVFHTGAAVRATKDESPWIGKGAPTDIVLDSWYLVPQRTTNVTVSNQLMNDDQQDKTVSYTNPMSALFNLWNARNTQNPSPSSPLPEEAYALQSSLKVYDEGGAEHELTIYFDKVNNPVYDTTTTPATLMYEVQGLPAGYQMYEYLVTIPPSEDLRHYGGTYDPATNTVAGGTDFYDPAGTNTSTKAGVLMSGVLIFNGSGQLVNQTAYTYGATETPAANSQLPPTFTPDALTSWQPTKFSSNGLPVFTANFTGQPLANSVSEMLTPVGGLPYSQAQEYIVELDFGLANAGGTWNSPATATSLASLTVGGIPPVIPYTTAVATMATADRKESATANATQFISEAQQDGYSSGVLNGYNIDTNGVLYGRYSNNITLPLWQMTLYDFRNLQGLRREGGNLYSQTMESGNARWSIPGNAGFGSTQAYNIEQSNVDMAREFVQMISTQRGFQANSKSVSTVDTMLETVIGMKR
jgi:flagellar hook protein FlgE